MRADELAKSAAQGQTSPVGNLCINLSPTAQLPKNKPTQSKSMPCGKNSGRTHHSMHKWNRSTNHSHSKNSERFRTISHVPTAASSYRYTVVIFLSMLTYSDLDAPTLTFSRLCTPTTDTFELTGFTLQHLCYLCLSVLICDHLCLSAPI
jgi:hypothetical protein